MRFASIVPVLLVSMLSACGGGGSVDSRDAPRPEPTATPQNAIGAAAAFTPNSFLTFINKQVGLGAGDYEVVVGTAGAGTTGSFSIRIERDGAVEVLDGSWEAGAAGGLDDPFHAGNPRFPVSLAEPGALVVEVESTEDVVVFLVRGNRVLSRTDANGAGAGERLALEDSAIDSRAFADAYYATVDPMDQRATLEGWRQANAFSATPPEAITNAVFRDAKDLGYGRDMYAWEHDCGIAIYEDNYVVQVEPGDASTYGPINLDAAIDRERRFLVGSNALEFGPLSGGSCTDRSSWVVKFYTFAPPDGRADENGQPCPEGQQCRLKEVDFDGRGVKFMPGVCVICHGGTLRPPAEGATDFTEVPGDFASAARHVSIKSSSFSILIPESLEFSSRSGFTFDDQRENVAAINALVEDVFRAQQDERTDSAEDTANWSATFALEALEGLSEPLVIDSDFVPVGWREDAGAPAGAEELYEQVIEPYCLGCHALRGSKVAEANDANAVNFSSFEKFIAYRDLTIDYVYRRGVMPLSLISYAKFWEDPVAPTVLADALGIAADDALRAAGGRPLEPGRPVARPGPERRLYLPPALPGAAAPTRTVEIDGSASDFSTGFRWRIVEQAADATLEDDDQAVARLTVSAPGVYRLGLVTSNAEFASGPEAIVDLEFTSEMLDDRATVFVARPDQQQNVAIENLFGLDGAGCTDCHNDQQAEFTGIPLYLERASFADSAEFYRAVRERVDFAEPALSRLLTKPLGSQLLHAGSEQGPLFRAVPCSDANDDACTLDPDGEQRKYEQYQQLLSWIEAGAPCGSDTDVCGFEVPPAPPAPPSDLQAGAPRYAAVDQEVDLVWRDNAVDETQFVVERALDADFTSVETRVVAGPNLDLDVATTDTGLLALTTYFYRVAAENAAGRSPFSEVVEVTTLVPPAPAVPSFLTDSPRELSDTEIQLRWEQAGVGIGGAPIGETTGFRIERRLAGGTLAPIETQTRGPCSAASPCEFTDDGLTPETEYTYRVCALDVPGAIEQCSAEGTAETLAEPPAAPTITLTVTSTTSVRVQWTPPAAGGAIDSYRVERSQGAGAFAEVTFADAGCLATFDCLDEGLTADTEYTYRVCAIGAGGEACSDPGSVTTTVAPSAPVLDPVVVFSDVELRLSWSAGAGGGTVVGYRVERDQLTGPGGAVVSSATIPAAAQPPFAATTLEFENDSLAVSTTYRYRVCAIGSDAALLGAGNVACSAFEEGTTVAAGNALWTSGSVPGTCSGCHGPINAPVYFNGTTNVPFQNPASAQYLYDAVRLGPGTM
ncbi:MAG: fibronectin type III domain-containing protein, partial [Pseudomonadales bacterium]|nr:fibronectin type III domain-containing protein [Pseudomonadales bacterium]